MTATTRYGLTGPYRLTQLADIEIDNRGVNPLVDYAHATDAERAHQVAGFAEAPKMFSAGTADLPPFTASGLPPEELLKLPFGMRHAVAAEPNITKVYEFFEEDLDPAAVIPCEALETAYYRVQTWLEKTDTRTAEDLAQEEAQHEDMLRMLGFDPNKRGEGPAGAGSTGRGGFSNAPLNTANPMDAA
ncbi:MAG: hypothetical protein QM747_18270 [Nocardioides sp.]